MSNFIALDLPAILASSFACLSCALVGNFLVLRRRALMGDALSHAVLPGIVISFLLFGSRAGIAPFIGAAIAAVLCSLLISSLQGLMVLESGAAMGVVFSIFFALGILVLELASARNLDLDADCLLYGQLETIFWFPPEEYSLATLSLLPVELVSSFFVLLAISAAVFLLRKELKAFCFDSEFFRASGYSGPGFEFLLATLVGLAVVVSFKVVGSILVIGMLVLPAATARLCTSRYSRQILLSLLFCEAAVLLGYLLSQTALLPFGISMSLSASGMIVCTSGFIFLSTLILSPEYGVLARTLRRRSLSRQVEVEDLLGRIFRLKESGRSQFKVEEIQEASARALERLLNGGLLLKGPAGELTLSEAGESRARALVRKHRLIENYFSEELGLSGDHLHEPAEQLEHFTSSRHEQELRSRLPEDGKDPHGKEIPD